MLSRYHSRWPHVDQALVIADRVKCIISSYFDGSSSVFLDAVHSAFDQLSSVYELHAVASRGLADGRHRMPVWLSARHAVTTNDGVLDSVGRDPRGDVGHGSGGRHVRLHDSTIDDFQLKCQQGAPGPLVLRRGGLQSCSLACAYKVSRTSNASLRNRERSTPSVDCRRRPTRTARTRRAGRR